MVMANHLMTQGKVERYHCGCLQSLCSSREEPEPATAQGVPVGPGAGGRLLCGLLYNHQRKHGSPDNVTPADVYFGRVKEVLSRHADFKRQALETRHPQHTQSLRMPPNRRGRESAS